MSRTTRRPLGVRALAGTALLAAVTAAGATAQDQDLSSIRLQMDRTEPRTVAVSHAQGFAAVPVAVLGDLGWTVSDSSGLVRARAGAAAEIVVRPAAPFVWWNGRPIQLVDGPYRARDGAVHVPLQLLTEFLPARLPGFYAFEGSTGQPPTLRAGDPASGAELEGVHGGARPDEGLPDAESRSRPDPESAPDRGDDASAREGRGDEPGTALPVVWIDAGHGGADPGAIGAGGLREKDIALGIARRLRHILSTEPGIEVRLTREDDRFVDLWDRGLQATEAKGERPGVFVSIHANSLPTGRATRGFETYFLSEARTDDERRVSAIENAPLSIRGRGVDANRRSDLEFILRELRNFDHQHWSALLAEMVQEELARFHPGPNRGVKQGPLAVLTNALMPAVLVEVGFVSNPAEASLMSREDFQQRAASALARAVGRFLERYPPGDGRDPGG